jgi:hypothetical protein
VQRSLGSGGSTGFSYLSSHGSLDIEHVELFKNLINGFEDPRIQDDIIATAKVMYHLYGAIFEDIGMRHAVTTHAA